MKKFLILFSVLILPVAITAAQTLIPSQNQKEKWGYLNEDGTIALEFRYDDASAFADGRAKVKKGQKWGYIDSNGNEVIKIQYSEIGTWDSGRCKVAIGGSEKNGTLTGAKYGFIDEQGNTLLKAEYDKIGPFEDGLAYIVKGGKYGYIDESLQFVVPCNYSAIGKFNPQGYCWIATGGKIVNGEVSNAKYGIIKRDGSIIAKPAYLHIGTFNQRIAEANPIFCQALNGTDGKELSKKLAKEAQKGMSSKSFAAVFTGSKGYIDDVKDEMVERTKKAAEKHRLQVIEMLDPEMIRIMDECPEWDLLGYSFIDKKLFSMLDMSINENFAVSSAALCSIRDIDWSIGTKGIDKIGILDKEGNVVLKPGLYNVAFLPSEGLIPVVKTNKKGFEVNYVTDEGKLLLNKWVPAIGISPFVNGVAVIHGEGNQYLIDKLGKSITNAYSLILPQSNGNHLIKDQNGYGIITKSGQEIIEPVWDLILPDQNNLYCARQHTDGKFGYLDLAGQFSIQPAYDEAKSFENNTASVKTAEGWGLIDNTGKTIVPCNWESVKTVSPHNDMGCWAKDGEKWYFINLSSHKPIFQESYYGVDNYDADGTAIINSSDNLFGCIDRNGKSIIPMRLSSSALVKECLREMKDNNINSITEIEAHRYNLNHNPSRNGFRLSHTIDNSMWEY